MMVLLVLAAGGVAWLAHNAGVENGLARSAAGEAPAGPPGYWYAMRPFGPGFGLLGLLGDSGPRDSSSPRPNGATCWRT